MHLDVFELAWTTRPGRKDVDTATKHTEEAQVRDLASTDLIWRLKFLGMRDKVVDTQVVMESKWPKTSFKTSTRQDSTKSVAN